MTKAEIHNLAVAADKAAAALRDALQLYFDDRDEPWLGRAAEDWRAMIDLADSAQDDLAAIAEALV